MKIKATLRDQRDLRIRTAFTATRLQDMTDVDTSVLEDGSVLVYSADLAKFQSTRTLEKQIINGGNY